MMAEWESAGSVDEIREQWSHRQWNVDATSSSETFRTNSGQAVSFPTPPGAVLRCAMASTGSNIRFCDRKWSAQSNSACYWTLVFPIDPRTNDVSVINLILVHKLLYLSAFSYSGRATLLPACAVVRTNVKADGNANEMKGWSWLTPPPLPPNVAKHSYDSSAPIDRCGLCFRLERAIAC